MSVFLLFVIIFLISALGSTPPGLINLIVLERSITSGKKAGVMTALGTFIPEFVYTYLAAFGFVAINNNVALGQNIQLVSGVVLVSLAGFYFFRKAEEPDLGKVPSSKDNFRSFRKGFFTASINMLIIPFWAFAASTLHSYGFELSAQSEIFAFALASALGALVMFLVYVRLGHLIVNRMNTLIRYTNKFLAVVFLTLGLYQLIRLY